MSQSENTVRLSIRLNMDKEADRKAWEYFQRMNRQKYKSVNRAVITAVNDHFDRQDRMLHDSYLETREKEDAFLRQIQETIERSLQAVTPMGALSNLLPLLKGIPPAPVVPADNTEDMDAALDFVNSF